MKKGIIKLNSRITATLLVMAALLTFSCLLSKNISVMEEQVCWDELRSSLDDFSAEIVARANSNRALLDSIANIIASQDSIDSPEVRKIIDGFRPNDMISDIALLLLGDKIMLPNEPLLDGKGVLSFETESALGRHISNRSTDIRDESKLVLRHFVPVEKDGKTVAMLYSVVDLQSLKKIVNYTAYDNHAEKLMYEDKKNYYDKMGINSRVRI